MATSSRVQTTPSGFTASAAAALATQGSTRTINVSTRPCAVRAQNFEWPRLRRGLAGLLLGASLAAALPAAQAQTVNAKIAPDLSAVLGATTQPPVVWAQHDSKTSIL